MSKTLGIIIGIVAIAGIAWYAVSQSPTPSMVVTTTQTPDDSTGVTPTPPAPTQPSMPSVVTNKSAVPTDTTVVLTGSITPNGAFTTYWYEYGTTANMGSKTVNQMAGSGFSTIPAPSYIVGLTKDTTYYFRLNAQNQFGQVSDGQYTFTTTHGFPAPTGSAPATKTLSADGISRTTANVNGEVTPNQGDTQYWFEYGPTTNLGNTTAFVSAGNGTAKVSASMSLSDLTPATTYSFRLNAQNQYGTVNGAILNFKTNGPPAQTAPTVSTQNATAVSTSTVSFHGTINPNGADTNYWFEYSTDQQFGGGSVVSTAHVSAGGGVASVSVRADITALSISTTYYFRTVGENSAGIVRGDVKSFKTK